jgi:hypothetical protein
MMGNGPFLLEQNSFLCAWLQYPRDGLPEVAGRCSQKCSGGGGGIVIALLQYLVTLLFCWRLWGGGGAYWTENVCDFTVFIVAVSPRVNL